MSAASRRLHRRRARDLATCSDCNNDVEVNGNGSDLTRVRTFHDPTCPCYHQTGGGRPFSVVLLLPRGVRS